MVGGSSRTRRVAVRRATNKLPRGFGSARLGRELSCGRRRSLTLDRWSAASGVAAAATLESARRCLPLGGVGAASQFHRDRTLAAEPRDGAAFGPAPRCSAARAQPSAACGGGARAALRKRLLRAPPSGCLSPGPAAGVAATPPYRA